MFQQLFQAFVITLREGLEAFLIVAISIAYLKKSGRRELVSAVHWGIALAVAISIGAASSLVPALPPKPREVFPATGRF